jgi:YaiO family outer membrane protein
MHVKPKYFSLLLLLICVTPSFAAASTDAPSERRLEGEVSYEYLSPYAAYGSWKAVSFGLYGRQAPLGGYYVRGTGFSRDEGEAVLGTAGAYTDWTRYLYTHAAFSFGTDSAFLPRYRADLDLNFKFGPQQKIVATAGFTRVAYFTGATDTTLSPGLTLYQGKWILEYRYFANRSDPGNVDSSTNLLSAGYGREGDRWSFLTVTAGGQGYLAGYVSPAALVRQDFFSVDLKHRRWLNRDLGIFGGLGFMRLYNGYDKYAVSMGFFRGF